MVAQVVVRVADELRERHARPQFVQIRRRVRAVGADPLGDFKIAVAVLAVRRAEHRHGRGIVNAARTHAVKALGEERRPGLGELLCARLRNDQADLPRRQARRILARADIPFVFRRRELRR